MRRSICFSEPSQALAGEVNTWKFTYTPAVNLPKGTLLRFDLATKGRPIDWQIPETSLKKTSNIIYGLLPNGKVVQAEAVEIPQSFVPQFQFALPQELPAGASFTICIGAPKGAHPQKNGNTCQLTIQRRRSFLLYIDPTGKANFSDHETFTFDIKGNTLHAIKVLAPSFAIKNKRFDVVLRFEDEYGNLTNNAPEKTLIELSHENLRENLKWKIFIPETGFITLPNLYFNEAGVYTIQLQNLTTKEIFCSSPIKCFGQDTKQLFWGLLHGESERFDSTESIESCLRHFRDERSTNFYGTSSFESQEETSNEMWKLITQNVEEFDEAERFSAFLGFQWVGDAKTEGVRHIIYAKDQKSILRKKDQRSNTLKKIYKLCSPKEIISIACFTMGKGFEYNFHDFQPEFERVAEIYNAWGCCELTKDEGNLRPIQSSGKKGISEAKEGALQRALLHNCRFGFVAGGLDDRGMYADFYDSDQAQYSPGLTAVIAPDLSRQSIFDALYNRSCYATTGERIILGLSLAGHQMGSELDSGVKPGLHVNRHLSGFVAGTSKLKLVEVIRNGKVLTKFTPKSHILDFDYDDMIPLVDAVVDANDKKPPFAFYYLRVLQEDGHMAWSSPIWVDYVPNNKSNKEKPVAAKPVAVKPVAVKPVAVKPVAVKPMAAKTVATKPAVTKPVAAKPAAKLAAKPTAKTEVKATKKATPTKKK